MQEINRRNFIKKTIYGFAVIIAASAGGGCEYRFEDEKKLSGNSFWKNVKYIEHLDIHLVEHCNLKCKYCYHYSCIADEEYAEPESFENDIKKLSEVTEQKVKRIFLDGGEPLLHPRVNDLIAIARKYLPLTEIHLVTNGLLLNSKGEDFWKAMHDNSIVINHSPYPVNVDTDAYYEKAEKYKVKTDKTKSYIRKNSVSTFGKIGLHPKGNLDFEYNWKLCDCKNRCSQYVSGKIFACPAVAYIRHFNKKFGYNFEITENDYIDLYKTENIDKIFDFYSKPFPFCRYCRGFVCTNPWEQSEEHEASEWIE